MGEVVGLKSGKSVNEYMELVEVAEDYLKKLHVLRTKRGVVVGDYDKAVSILKEIKFCGRFSPWFRDESIGHLDAIVDELYIAINEEEELLPR